VQKLINRVNKLEKQIIPRVSHFVIMLRENETYECALAKSLSDSGVETIPIDCFVIMLDLAGRARNHDSN